MIEGESGRAGESVASGFGMAGFRMVALITASFAITSLSFGEEAFVGTVPEPLRTLSEGYSDYEELQAFHKKFLGSWDLAIDSAIVPRLRKLRENYFHAILAEREKSKQAGELETTIAYTEERELLEQGGAVPLPDPASPQRKLQNMREVYHRTNRAIIAEIEEKQKSMLSALATAAEGFSKELVTKDKLDEAVAAKELARLAETELKRAAEETMDLPTIPKPKLKPIDLPIIEGGDHLKNFEGLLKLLPLGFELTKDGALDVEKMERLNLGLRSQRNRVAQWLVTMKERKPSALHGARERITCAPQKIRIGGREFEAQVFIYHSEKDDFIGKKKGNTFEVVGRVAFCQLRKDKGGTLRIDIAGARLKKPEDAESVVLLPLPEVKITKASWGSGGSRMNVRDLVQEKVVFRQESVRATRGSMGGDPAPYWQKNLSVSFLIGEKKGSLSRHEGSGFGLEDLFAIVAPKDEKAPAGK